MLRGRTHQSRFGLDSKSESGFMGLILFEPHVHLVGFQTSRRCGVMFCSAHRLQGLESADFTILTSF
ncbi:hypothetical protein F0562_025073 [Nyssa sinensis]|uniref:Uncharacterized protein n=1 Tax=Nyssa sinensis TaxID=561372 RepID=A0A5J5BFR8_9ASTE|nr:hypothetical protein F0562_025073 [Nyssa sinensis]